MFVSIHTLEPREVRNWSEINTHTAAPVMEGETGQIMAKLRNIEDASKFYVQQSQTCALHLSCTI
ncbi:hypothetical protein Z948_167 [Sulfitobacter donghicola DSW-25 = KCTC 12864 = JCM 14565]|nr:hypothetical protein Z948_167 [Sulfitobacter donghicola DSW-25 = KCTC 12864 = JCM 14565]